MNKRKENKYQVVNFIPFIGIAIFVGLYIFSSTLYPGGSQVNLNSEGFDWVNNYWCNLMNEKGMNGEPNPAKSISISALIILCISLMIFFIQYAKTYSKSRLWRRIIIICGVVAMAFAMMIFTKYHNLMTIISSVFGLFVVIGILREIYKSEQRIHKISGMICILLLGLNNYIYYTQQFIEALPLLQKITFAFVLIWIVGLNYELVKRNKN